MANGFYAPGKERILRGEINFLAADIRAVLVKSTYVPNLNSHSSLADIPTSARSPTSVLLTGKSITNGVFDADDVTFPALPAGDTYQGIVRFQSAATDTNSYLLVFIDDVLGFPAPSGGGDFVIRWDNGPARIFAL